MKTIVSLAIEHSKHHPDLPSVGTEGVAIVCQKLRAFELGAVAELLEQLLSERDELASRVSELERDTERMNWLEQNLFHIEPDEWTAKYSPHLNTWRIFAPKGVQGSARAIIDAALASKEQP